MGKWLGSLYEIPVSHSLSRRGILPTLYKTKGHTCRCSRPKSPDRLDIEYQPARVRAAFYAGTVYHSNVSAESMAGMCENTIMSEEFHCVVLMIG